MKMILIKDVLSYLTDQNISFTCKVNQDIKLNGFSSLNNYKPGSFTWVKKQENIPKGFDEKQITLAFVSNGVVGNFQNYISIEDSKRAFFSTIEHFYSDDNNHPSVGKFTYIGPNVSLGENVHIGHNCCIDGDIIIGDNTTIGNNVTIVNQVSIGKNCDIHSGVVMGQDGFSYTEDDSHKKKMNKHFGGITIGDDVYIAMNTVVERGIIDDTIIKSGVKIDCLCLIGHNSIIEENAALVGGTIVYGSVHIGNNAYLAGPLIRNQCHIGDNAFVGLGAVVTQNVDNNDLVIGIPAKSKK